MYGTDAKIGRAGRPDRAEARRGEEGHGRLHGIGRARHHAVAAANTQADQAGAGTTDQVAKFAVGDRSFEPVLACEHDGHAVVVARVMGQRVLGVVERCPRKPLRAGHVSRAQCAESPIVEAHPEVLRRSRPERLDFAHRPGVQRRVVGIRDRDTQPAAHEPGKPRNSAGRG